ncbi:MAG TPA: hypothetical protein VN698_10585, partial [Bacteroidia bacterium]|nr:hypothetical protein [Bacteroidia bacterium]
MKTNNLKIILLTAAFLVAGFLAKAQDKKISQLPALPSVSGNEAIPLAISGTNYYLTPSQLKSWLNIIGYVPLVGTSSGNPLTGTLEFDNSVSTLNAAIWKNTSLGTAFYIALTDNKTIASSSHGSFIQFNDGQIIQSAFNALSGNGVLNLQPGASEISAYDNSGNNARTFFLPYMAYIQSNSSG